MPNPFETYAQLNSANQEISFFQQMITTVQELGLKNNPTWLTVLNSINSQCDEFAEKQQKLASRLNTGYQLQFTTFQSNANKSNETLLQETYTSALALISQLYKSLQPLLQTLTSLIDQAGETYVLPHRNLIANAFSRVEYYYKIYNEYIIDTGSTDDLINNKKEMDEVYVKMQLLQPEKLQTLLSHIVNNETASIGRDERWEVLNKSIIDKLQIIYGNESLPELQGLVHDIFVDFNRLKSSFSLANSLLFTRSNAKQTFFSNTNSNANKSFFVNNKADEEDNVLRKSLGM